MRGISRGDPGRVHTSGGVIGSVVYLGRSRCRRTEERCSASHCQTLSLHCTVASQSIEVMIMIRLMRLLITLPAPCTAPLNHSRPFPPHSIRHHFANRDAPR